MARKKPTPIITYTELICTAIIYFERRVQSWRESIGDLPDAQEMLNDICKDDLAKIEALKTMYRFETGVDYE